MYIPQKTIRIALEFTDGIRREFRPSACEFGKCAEEWIKPRTKTRIHFSIQKKNGDGGIMTLKKHRRGFLVVLRHEHEVESIRLASRPKRHFGKSPRALKKALDTWIGEDGPDLDNLFIVIKPHDGGKERACVSMRIFAGVLEAAFVRKD